MIIEDGKLKTDEDLQMEYEESKEKNGCVEYDVSDLDKFFDENFRY